VRIGFHDSFRSWPRRFPGNGGAPSQPQPKMSRLPPSGGAGESGGGAADEAAARRKLQACPLADAKAACFVKRPHGDQAAFGRAGRQGGTKAFGPRNRPAEAGLRFARRHRRGGASAARRRAGPGFGPGAANPAGPRISVHGLSGGTEASAEDPVFSGTAASAGVPKRRGRGCEFPIRRAANRQGFGPDGEPAGNPEGGFGRRRTPEEAAREPPVSAPPTRNRPARDASPPRQGLRAGKVGAGSDAGPHYRFRGARARGQAGGWRGHFFWGMS
jgi:hypothetical protein